MPITLKHPITYNDGSIDITVREINFTRFKAKHLKIMPASFKKIMSGSVSVDEVEIDVDEMLPLIAALVELPEDVVGEIDMLDDISAIIEELGVFLGKSQAT